MTDTIDQSKISDIAFELSLLNVSSSKCLTEGGKSFEERQELLNKVTPNEKEHEVKTLDEKVCDKKTVIDGYLLGNVTKKAIKDDKEKRENKVYSFLFSDDTLEKCLERSKLKNFSITFKLSSIINESKNDTWFKTYTPVIDKANKFCNDNNKGFAFALSMDKYGTDYHIEMFWGDLYEKVINHPWNKYRSKCEHGKSISSWYAVLVNKLLDPTFYYPQIEDKCTIL